MSTSAVCGYSGTVTGPAGVTEVTQWEVTLNVAAEEATSMASGGFKEKIACLRSGTFTFRSIGHAAAMGACSISLSTGHGLTIGGSGIVSKCDIETPVSGIVSYNHSGTFTGAISGGLLPLTPP